MKVTTRVNVWLAARMLEKVQKLFRRDHHSPFPIILINGTTGKTSQTLLLKSLFISQGWTVFSGADENGKSLNSITGLCMIIGGFHVGFEGKNPGFKKFWFIIRCLFFLIFESYKKLPEKTILIHEVGFDHQNESKQVLEVFKQGVELLITTNVTYEHTHGFSDELNHDILLKIKNILPKKWTPVFESNEIETSLKNIALEQFSLLQIAGHYIVPASIGVIDNWVMDNLEGTVRTHHVNPQRGNFFSLKADNDLEFSESYLLPLSFARTAHVTLLVARYFGIEDSEVKRFLKEARLPNGRFSMLNGILSTTIVDSTYNSDPQSLQEFLNLFGEVIQAGTQYNQTRLLPSSQKKLIGHIPKHYVVLGEMRELGDSSLIAHKDVLDRLISLGKQWGEFIENIYLLGKEWIKCDDDGIVKIHEKVSFITYRKQLFKVFERAGDIKPLLSKETLRPTSWVWIKGSQNTIFLEILVKHLLENPSDTALLCRQGGEWDKIRAEWE